MHILKSIFKYPVFILIMGLIACNLGNAEPPECKRTPISMFVWGRAMIGEQPVKKGDVIIARVPDMAITGGCVGTFTVEETGNYGAMAIYGDDPTTPEKDGARIRDIISFRIITNGDKAEYDVSEIIVWTGQGEVKQFDVIVKPDK